MRVPRLCLPDAVLDGPCESELSLASDRAHYVAHVLRRRPGDAIDVFDGRGRWAAATLLRSGRRDATVALVGPVHEEAPPPLRCLLALALVKGAALDHCVQKATELGASGIQLLVSERSERRVPAERVANLLAHLHAVAMAACEQCGRNWLPAVAPPRGIDDFLATLSKPATGARWLLEPGQPPPAPNALTGGHDLTLLSGPEGGFSPAEASAARAAAFTPIGLGPRILRADTAPVVALALAQYLAGDLSPAP